MDHPLPPHRPRLRRLPGHHETIVYWAMTITMTRRLARLREPADRRQVSKQAQRNSSKHKSVGAQTTLTARLARFTGATSP